MDRIQDVLHDSTQERFRQPFGAVECGTTIRLALAVEGILQDLRCTLRLRIDEKHEGRTPMKPDESGLFWVEFKTPDHPGLLWYYFILENGGDPWYYGNNPQHLGGVGVFGQEAPKSYQITLYRKRAVPSWYKEGIMYQVYVDRFFNGYGDGTIRNPKEGAILEEDWSTRPTYRKTPEGRIDRWNFYGGNLLGILKKLDYLEELGVSILYLNPIFEAASNHKYDTADYHRIDPMYGDEELFDELIHAAGKRGIRLILDGVFSHTGADSLYFNRNGRYPTLGAYQSKDSPYYPWYRFLEYPHRYASWWGVDDLPECDKSDPSFRDFIYGKEGVVRHWLKKGIGGWRLDVVDELPDPFVKGLVAGSKETDPDSVIIGEVWEDASRKVSYGVLREYFGGEELDGAMNYPLRQLLLDYLLGHTDSHGATHRLFSLYENYPRENFLASMNLLGSHDRERILTLLGETWHNPHMTDEDRKEAHLTPEERERGIRRLKLMALIQFTLPGVPCIYYGDEVGVEGYTDPYNRATYPWGKEDQDLLGWYRKLSTLRREYDHWQTGAFRTFSPGDNLFAFCLKKEEEEEILVYANGYVDRYATVRLEQDPDQLMVQELLTGTRIQSNELVLHPLEAKVLLIRKKPRGIPLTRGSGILMHLSSLPSPWGIGDLGLPAMDFIGFLQAAGQGLWQILPTGPIGEGNTPYLSYSPYAGAPLYISMEGLMEAGLLTQEDLEEGLKDIRRVHTDVDQAAYEANKIVKGALLRKAYENYRTPSKQGGDHALLDRMHFETFREGNAWWLENYVLYQILSRRNEGKVWQDWPRKERDRDPRTLDRIRLEEADEVAHLEFVQFVFWHQWHELKKVAGKAGVRILGDLPLYVAENSSVSWAAPTDFQLKEDGRPLAVAGVPPDYFSPTGQRWGNPLYDWRAMEKEGFGYFKDRIRQGMEQFDRVRLDHFRGFEAYWRIPVEDPTAMGGSWRKGPGRRLFEALERDLGPLPVIAEDLGFLTPEVGTLKDLFAYPGMLVYPFSQELIDEGMVDLSNTVLYSGTHDTDTLLSWRLGTHGEREDLEGSLEACRTILENLQGSDAPWVILPMQDVLLLPGSARMNTPGTAEGNWGWVCPKEALTQGLAKELLAQAKRNGRI